MKDQQGLVNYTAGPLGKYKKDLDTMFYDIYWGEELMKTIRTTDFAKPNAATFLTSEMGLSLMLFMPRIEDETVKLGLERKKGEASRQMFDYDRLQSSKKDAADAPL